jgi:hypothetical protein
MRPQTSNGRTLRELAFRACDGLSVRLLWCREDDRLTVSVSDSRSGRYFELEAPHTKALDVFYHPFSYTSAAAVAA